jgi:hypothetical protein
MAHLLIANGLRPGDRVALLYAPTAADSVWSVPRKSSHSSRHRPSRSANSGVDRHACTASGSSQPPNERKRRGSSESRISRKLWARRGPKPRSAS